MLHAVHDPKTKRYRVVQDLTQRSDVHRYSRYVWFFPSPHREADLQSIRSVVRVKSEPPVKSAKPEPTAKSNIAQVNPLPVISDEARIQIFKQMSAILGGYEAIETYGEHALLLEYRRYMALRKMQPHGTKMRLPPIVNSVWRSHILCTRHYESFCQQNFPEFQHHDPLLCTSAFAYLHRNVDSSCNYTLKAYRTMFGQPPSDMWFVVTRRFCVKYIDYVRIP